MDRVEELGPRAKAEDYFEKELRGLVHRLGKRSELTLANKVMVLARMDMVILEAILETGEAMSREAA